MPKYIVKVLKLVQYEKPTRKVLGAWKRLEQESSILTLDE